MHVPDSEDNLPKKMKYLRYTDHQQLVGSRAVIQRLQGQIFDNIKVKSSEESIH